MKRQLVRSVSIRSIGYNAHRRILEVEFRSGDYYRYSEVPANVHHALMASGSKDGYLQRYILDEYPATKVGH